MKILLMLSDDRMKYLKNYLELNHDVEIFYNQETLNEKQTCFDILVLPLVTFNGNSFLWKKQCILLDNINKSEKFCIVSAFSSKFPMQDKVYAYLEDETFIKENAVLTALGILYYMLDLSKKSIFSQSVDILGYGECGKALSELLNKLNVQHRIIRRKSEKENEITYEIWEKSLCGDIIVQCTSFNMLEVKKHILEVSPIIIDICSQTNVNIQEFWNHGIIYVKTKSLPVLFTAESGAALIHNFMKQEVLHET